MADIFNEMFGDGRRTENFDESVSNTSRDSGDTAINHLEAIERSIADIQEDISSISTRFAGMSMSAAFDRSREGVNGRFNEQYRQRTWNNQFRNRGRRSEFFDTTNLSQGFAKNFKESLLQGFLGSNFRDEIKGTFEGLADDFDLSVKEIPGKIGQQLGKQVFKGLRSNSVTGPLVNNLTGAFGQLKDVGLNVVKDVGTQLLSGTATFASIGSSLSALAPALLSLASAALPIAAVVAGFVVLSKAIAPAVEGIKSLANAAKSSSTRDKDTRKKALELEKKRIHDDVETLITYPFQILKEAAEDLQQTWSNNLSTIGQTQGYTKDDVMSLMSSLASRLRSDGLSDVIAGTDLMSSLSKVLASGLSGSIAEEFTYQALKLNKAIPTQDFFSFAANYASVAANAIKDGKSQSEAIAAANVTLNQFANNLVYASRELTGGFTTGLQDASELYSKAVKIAQAARSDNVNEISGVLTSLSAVTGAIAPDLASSLTDVIYKAATGGNSSEIVALRSLANINASNTEFLRQFAESPQKIIATMLNNLGTMFSQSDAAYMEKAEGYASLFGISSDAFARVDFNYLAQQIANMDTSSTALEDNLKLLASGQTTTSKEQQKIAEINKMMIEEGLSYVIDNEVGQMIQQHMWDEQMQRELMEAEYGVELRGAALEFLEGLKETVNNILNILNPAAWFRKLAGNLIATTVESYAQKADIKQVLELGKVGRGTARELYNLTTTNRDLNLTPSTASLFGGLSAYEAAHSATKVMQAVSNPGLTLMNGVSDLYRAEGVLVNEALSDARNYISNAVSGSSIGKSVYKWGGLTSKSDAAVLSSLISTTVPAAINATKANESSLSVLDTNSMNAQQARIESMIATIDSYVEDHKTYDEWVQSASRHGIADFSKALEDSGYSAVQLESYFQAKETEQGVKIAHEMSEAELQFYRTAIQFMSPDTGDFWAIYNNPLTENILLVHSKQDEMISKLSDYVDIFTLFKKDWEKHWKEYANYYLYHKIYGGSTLNLSKLQEVQKAEKDEEGDLMTGLSKYLSSNDWNLEDFQNPQIQTNALLAKILMIVTSIMNQNNEKVGSVSLADSLAALSMGMTNTVQI